MGEKLGLSISRLREPGFEDLDDAGVEVLAARFGQGAVGCVLDQGVLEGIGGLERGAAAEHELG